MYDFIALYIHILCNFRLTVRRLSYGLYWSKKYQLASVLKDINGTTLWKAQGDKITLRARVWFVHNVFLDNITAYLYVLEDSRSLSLSSWRQRVKELDMLSVAVNCSTYISLLILSVIVLAVLKTFVNHLKGLVEVRTGK